MDPAAEMMLEGGMPMTSGNYADMAYGAQMPEMGSEQAQMEMPQPFQMINQAELSQHYQHPPTLGQAPQPPPVRRLAPGEGAPRPPPELPQDQGPNYGAILGPRAQQEPQPQTEPQARPSNIGPVEC